jgi:hypothetical protein
MKRIEPTSETWQIVCHTAVESIVRLLLQLQTPGRNARDLQRCVNFRRWSSKFLATRELVALWSRGSQEDRPRSKRTDSSAARGERTQRRAPR